MTDHTALEHAISDIFERRLHLRVPSMDTDLFESGGLDSLSFVELLLQLELEYGVRIPLQDLEPADFSSVRNIAGFIRQRLEEANSRSAGRTPSLSPEPPALQAGPGPVDAAASSGEPEPQYPYAEASSSSNEPEVQYLYIEAKCPA